jgi:putative transposase
MLVQWKQETPWLSEAPGHALQQAILDLDRAYTNFFKKRAQFPKFHKKGIRDSLRESDAKCIKLDQVNSRIQLPKIGWVRYRNSREVLGEIRNVTVSLSVGKWFVSISTLREVEQPLHASRSSVGLDWGVARFYTLSDGEYQDPLQPLKKFLPKLAKLQRRLARKKKFSSHWKKAKAKISKLHSKIANIRKDFVHKSSHHISKNHAVVFRRPASKEYVCVRQGQEGKAGKESSPEVGTQPFYSRRKPVRTAPPTGVQDAVERRTAGTRVAPEHKPQVS